LKFTAVAMSKSLGHLKMKNESISNITDKNYLNYTLYTCIEQINVLAYNNNT